MRNDKKPAGFLEGIEQIVFDMDGVITSEQNYWNAAALTVYEMLNSNKYFGDQDIKVDLSATEIQTIREEVFQSDKLISLLKDRGVNTNWDLAFIILCTARILQSEGLFNTISYQQIYQYLSMRELHGMEIYEFIKHKLSLVAGMDGEYFERHGELWNRCQKVFQEWYLGEKAYIHTYEEKPYTLGKKGLMFSEQPIISLEQLSEILQVLCNSGIKLGIGTGRPFVEIQVPLVSWGIDKYFDLDSYITYTDVMQAEQKLEEKEDLAKPHPYVFLKAIYGKAYDDNQLLDGKYDRSKIDKTLIVGDAGSDIMAAQAINCKFAAVLTGVAGEKSRKYFEKMKADYILGSIIELINDN